VVYIESLPINFCGICARTDVITLALSSVILLIIDPRTNNTTPLYPELWIKFSISCEIKFVPSNSTGKIVIRVSTTTK
jgi:hypothetical protein